MYTVKKKECCYVIFTESTQSVLYHEPYLHSAPCDPLGTHNSYFLFMSIKTGGTETLTSWMIVPQQETEPTRAASQRPSSTCVCAPVIQLHETDQVIIF